MTQADPVGRWEQDLNPDGLTLEPLSQLPVSKVKGSQGAAASMAAKTILSCRLGRVPPSAIHCKTGFDIRMVFLAEILRHRDQVRPTSFRMAHRGLADLQPHLPHLHPHPSPVAELLEQFPRTLLLLFCVSLPCWDCPSSTLGLSSVPRLLSCPCQGPCTWPS